MKKYLIFTLFLLLASATQAQNSGQPLDKGRLKLTIHYLYQIDNTTAAPDFRLDTMNAGDPYSVVSPFVAGCHPDRDTVKGRMPQVNHEETVYYTRDKFQVTLEADPAQGGTLTGAGTYDYGTTLMVKATPNVGYEFVNWTEYADEVSTSANYTFEVTWDVELVAHFRLIPPTVGNIQAPQSICPGSSLELTTPTVANAQTQGWQISPDEQFTSVTAYTGQELAYSYNGWKLRFFATNAAGTVYSNVVAIKVYDMEPTLTGDDQICSLLTGTYTANHVSGELTWMVSDPAATITLSNKQITVTWATPGTQSVILLAENSETGCTGAAEMTVTVQSYINQADINKIVAKNNGKDYILIYPNPKDTYKYQWYKDGKPINGAKGQYYYQEGGLEPGVYKVYLSFNADANGNLFCGAFTDEYTVTAPATLGLCPNPAHVNEGIQVLNDNGGELTVSVYGIDGRLLHQQTVSGTQALLNVNLPKGLYLVKLIGNDTDTTQKLIIE